MTLAALAFAAGAALLQLQAGLPSLAWAAALPVLAAGAWRWRVLALPCALACGFLWAAACAHWRMADWLAPELELRDIVLTGVVAGLPAADPRRTRFELDVESAMGAARVPRRVLLSWYETAEPLHPGERWRFTVRLRRPRGLVNPHGLDYEAWLLEHGIGATGYVRADPPPVRMGERGSPFDRLQAMREAVRERFHERLGATPPAGILAALAVGDQRSISAEEWRLFGLTGVTHLMSISGLHVTLVSGLLAWLAAAAWRRAPPLALRLPARKAAAAAAIAAALGYTLLAGFAVPAQRTFWMVGVVAAALWSGRIASPWRTLALALGAVVLTDPWASLAPGFWLSFGAVLLIFYVGAGWSRTEPRLVQWGRMQWAITVGLAPAVLVLFAQVPAAGPLANALAIPLVSVVVTPIALVTALAPWSPLIDLAAWLVQWLLQYLEWCATLPGALWRSAAPPWWSVPLALCGVAWLLAPRGVPWRASGLALMAPAFLVAPPAPRPGEAWITVFDVGQGLAVLARTTTRALLYDAGPAFGEDADSGTRVILPALQAAGVSRLDALVVSHEDSDHLGGAQSVLETIEVDALASSLAERHPLNALAAFARACRAGERWQWDGVRFEFLHPGARGTARRRNDRSCVLRIDTAHGAVLLTGDIERSVEEALLQAGNLRPADVLLVPHHGSRSSSSRELIAAVSPRWAVISAGYRNRFGHPSAEVLARYAASGVTLLRTDRDGAVMVELGHDRVVLATERQRRRRYWLQ